MDFHCLLMCMIWQLKGSLLVLHYEGTCVVFERQAYTTASNVLRCCLHVGRVVGQWCSPLFAATSLEGEWPAQKAGKYLFITGVKSCSLFALRHKPAFALSSRAEKLGSNSGRYLQNEGGVSV